MHDHDDLKRLAEALLVRKDAAKAVGIEANVVPNEPNTLDLVHTHNRTRTRTRTTAHAHARKQTFSYECVQIRAAT